MKTYFNIIFLAILFFPIIILIGCESNNSTSISIDLQNKEDVAKIVARMQHEKEKYPDDLDKQKDNIYKILSEYGIDTKDERIKFAKKVQKYSYQKLFNEIMIRELKNLNSSK